MEDTRTVQPTSPKDLLATSLLARTPQPDRGREAVVASGGIALRHKGVRHVGAYEVAGAILTLRCGFGTFKASVGCGEPRKFARSLLLAICRRHADAEAQDASDAMIPLAPIRRSRDAAQRRSA